MAALLALASSLVWGSADFFGGMLTKRIPALIVVAVSQAAAVVVLAPWVLATHAWDAGWGFFPWSFLWAFTGPIGLAAFYYALAIGTMGVVSPISAMGILVPVTVGFARGERPNTLQVVAILVAIAGVILVGGPDVRTEDDAKREHGLKPIIFAVIAALGFGSSYVFVSLGAETSLSMTLITQRAMSACVAAVLVAFTVGWRRLAGRDVLRIGGVGAGDIAANALYGLSSTLGLLSVTAVFGSLFPVVTVFLARFLLHERLSRLQKLGVGLAMVGVVGLAGAGA